MPRSPKDKINPVPAVDRAIQILRTLATHNSGLGVSELSRQLGLNKSTTFDILTTLCHHHLVERNDSAKTYRLGYGLAELGHHVRERIDLRSVAHPHVNELTREIEETVFLGTFHDGYVTIVDKEEAPHDLKITSPVGRRIHYSAAAYGKIFLSALPEEEALKLLRDNPPRAYTPKSIVKPSAYRNVLVQVRKQGYALDDEEYLAGVRAVAAPINDAQGCVVAALCVVGFSARLPHDKLIRVAKQARDAAERISKQLGAKEYPMWKGVE